MNPVSIVNPEGNVLPVNVNVLLAENRERGSIGLPETGAAYARDRPKKRYAFEVNMLRWVYARKRTNERRI
jgi:hypothetical protein